MVLKKIILAISVLVAGACMAQEQSSSDSITAAWQEISAEVGRIDADCSKLRQLYDRQKQLKQSLDSMNQMASSQKTARKLLRSFRDERYVTLWLNDLLDTCYSEPYAAEALRQLPVVKNNEYKAEIDAKMGLIKPYGNYAKDLEKIVKGSKFYKTRDNNLEPKEYSKFHNSVSSSLYCKDFATGKVDTIPYLDRVTTQLLSMAAANDSALSNYCKSLAIVVPPTMPWPCDSVVKRECERLVELLDDNDVEMKKTRDEITNTDNAINHVGVNIEETQRELAAKWELDSGTDVLAFLEAKADSIRNSETFDESQRQYKYMILSNYIDATLNNAYNPQSVAEANEKIVSLPVETQRLISELGYTQLIENYGTYVDEIAKCLTAFKERCDKRKAWEFSQIMENNTLPKLGESIKKTPYYRNVYSKDVNIPFLDNIIDKILVHIKSGKMTQPEYEALINSLLGSSENN
ncbi:MAG: hypothetical protein IK092_04345 [Muribaculaceae bacterium]|nr:hypothetical protein [Muribaculaceae bacterium]